MFDYYTRIGDEADAKIASKVSNSAAEARRQQYDMSMVNDSFGYGAY